MNDEQFWYLHYLTPYAQDVLNIYKNEIKYNNCTSAYLTSEFECSFYLVYCSHFYRIASKVEFETINTHSTEWRLLSHI